MRSTSKALFRIAGLLSLGLGITGVFIPLLPTTPFLLLAAFLFSRSSERLHRWLLEHRLLGTYLRNYREGPAMTRQHKVLTLMFLWTGLGSSIAFAVHGLWARLALFAIGAGVTAHLLRIRTAPPGQRTAR